MILELLRQGRTIVEIQRGWDPANGPLGEAVAAAHEQLKKEQLMEQSAARRQLPTLSRKIGTIQIPVAAISQMV